MKRLLVWSTILVPPTFLILLSLKPLGINSLRLVSFLAATCLVALILALMTVPSLESRKRFRRQAAISLVTVVSIAALNWLLRMAYAFSRPAFEQVAAQVKAGEAIDTPRRIGWFNIERVEAPGPAANGINYHGLRLWTNIHPNGNTGFVQSSPDNLRFNLWSHFRLDETWQFISED